MTVAAVILAAGAATRFGSPKQLQDWQGQPLLRHSIWQALAAPVSQIVVVLGAHYPRTAPLVHGLPVQIAYNRHWSAGMSSSVQLGLRALRPSCEGALFMLADQPGVSPQVMQQIIDAFRHSGAPIVAPRAGQRQGNPVLFSRALFPELLQISGDQGGRALLRRYPYQVHWMDVDPRVLFDIDRPADLEFGRKGA